MEVETSLLGGKFETMSGNGAQSYLGLNSVCKHPDLIQCTPKV